MGVVIASFFADFVFATRGYMKCFAGQGFRPSTAAMLREGGDYFSPISLQLSANAPSATDRFFVCFFRSLPVYVRTSMFTGDGGGLLLSLYFFISYCVCLSHFQNFGRGF